MAIFTASERKEIFDHIVRFTEPVESIVSLIAIGSGSFGFTDELSDIDLIIAVDEKESLESVRSFVASKLKERITLAYFKEPEHIPMQLFLSDRFLEIDIGYGVYTAAAASRANWKVIFDKSGIVDKAMRDSWDNVNSKPKTDEYEKKLTQCADSVWHNLTHCATAIKRGQFWRANAELEIARQFLIELYCLKNSLEYERGRDVDKLPELELGVLKKTLAADLEPHTLYRSLVAVTDALYTLMERENISLPVGRQAVVEYLENCLIL